MRRRCALLTLLACSWLLAVSGQDAAATAAAVVPATTAAAGGAAAEAKPAAEVKPAVVTPALGAAAAEGIKPAAGAAAAEGIKPAVDVKPAADVKPAETTAAAVTPAATNTTAAAVPEVKAADAAVEEAAEEAEAEAVADDAAEAEEVLAEAEEEKKAETTKADTQKSDTADAPKDKDAKESKADREKKRRAKKEAFKNQIVEFAPSANVTFGDDIDDEGKCKAEIAKICDDVEEGESKLADCISDAIAAAENPDNGEDVDAVSDDCREEVYQFKITRNSNINLNVPLAKACKVDADKFCNVTWFFGYKSGQVISCLRDVKAQVTKPCRQQLFKIMLDAAVDIRADPMLYEACKEDSANLCKDVKNGGGRIQACLRDKRMQLSWACEEQLFRQEMENADDVRLSVRLFSKCLPDKKKFCKDIEPGNARTKDCLEEHRAELASSCKEEVDSMIERRVRDFRLDSRLRSSCENEIFNMCAYFGDLDDIDTYDSSVINCLQDYSAEIKSAECKRQVKKYVQLAAQDIRFDVPLAEACYEDRQKLCSNVPAGSARVIRCLTNSRDQLSPVCRATLFDEEVRFSENIDFQYPMKSACQKEIQRYCKDIPHGNAKVIRCLQDKKGEKDFGKPCREEVVSYEAEISKDYRLNYRLNKACQKDVSTLCPGLCQQNDGAVSHDAVCGGKVLRCLTDKLDQIAQEPCKKEVHYFEKMEVSNFRNDIILAEACREDVDKYCSSIEAGEGRVHRCLRDNRKKLSDACRKEELALELKENGNIELNVNLLKSCSAERQLFCKEVQTGQARVFRCLAENMNDADFGNNCKYQIIYKMQRRQANWKLDPPLRKACKDDVASKCATEDAANSEEGLVYKCLVKSAQDISDGCAKELGRAIHMAFYVWQPGAIITAECDDDIQRLCLAARPNMASRPGAIGSCLASVLERSDRTNPPARRMLADDKSKNATAATSDKLTGFKAVPKDDKPVTLASALKMDGNAAALGAGSRSGGGPKRSGSASATDLPAGTLSPKCWALADIAEPPNVKQAFDSALSFASLQNQLEKIELTTGVPLVARGPGGNAQGISLTGWMAMLGITALVVLVSYSAWVGYKRVRGIPDRDYSLVVKQQMPNTAA